METFLDITRYVLSQWETHVVVYIIGTTFGLFVSSTLGRALGAEK